MPSFQQKVHRVSLSGKATFFNKRIHLGVVPHLLLRCVGLLRHINYQGGTVGPILL